MTLWASLLIRKSEDAFGYPMVTEDGDSIYGILLVFRTKEAAERFADGRAEVLGLEEVPGAAVPGEDG